MRPPRSSGGGPLDSCHQCRQRAAGIGHRARRRPV